MNLSYRIQLALILSGTYAIDKLKKKRNRAVALLLFKNSESQNA